MDMNLHQDQAPIEGNWWNPLEPSVKWHGTLHMKAGENAKAHLVEYGETYLGPESKTPLKSLKIIHGVSKSGKAITLSKCFCIGRTRSSGSQELEFDIQEVLIGAHLLEEELLFGGVQVEFEYLNDWVQYRRFEEKQMTDDEGQREIRLRLNQDHQFPFKTNGYSEAQFYVGYRSHSGAFKFEIENHSNLQITYTEKKTLKEIFADLRQWRWFLTLGTRKDTPLMSVSLYRTAVGLDLEDVLFELPLDIWTSSPGGREGSKALWEPDMNFTLPAIRDNLSSVISKWKELQISWPAAMHRYFASIHRDGLQLSEQFLFRAQALEALYRAKTKKDKVTQKEAYGAAWEMAPASLKIKLGDKDSFVEAVRINRNYLTHYNPEDEKKASEFTSLFDLSQKLGFLLQAIILTEIAMPVAVIENSVDAKRWGRLVQFD